MSHESVAPLSVCDPNARSTSVVTSHLRIVQQVFQFLSSFLQDANFRLLLFYKGRIKFQSLYIFNRLATHCMPKKRFAWFFADVSGWTPKSKSPFCFYWRAFIYWTENRQPKGAFFSKKLFGRLNLIELFLSIKSKRNPNLNLGDCCYSFYLNIVRF